MADHLDRESDYGSDFTADEEIILNGLLQQAPHEFKSDPDLHTLQGDSGNHEKSIHDAAVFRATSRQPRRSQGPAASGKVLTHEAQISISLEGYGSTFTARRWRAPARTPQLTDFQAFSREPLQSRGKAE